jgi:ankyrin repeat protein
MDDIFDHLKNNNISFFENHSSLNDILSIRDKDGNTPLHIASGYNAIDCLRFIVNKTDVNVSNNHGDTPLHNTAYGNYEECMKILLEQKININPQNDYGNTPLMYAALKNSITSIKILLEHNADTSIQNRDGMNFFDLLDEDVKKFIEEYKRELQN